MDRIPVFISYDYRFDSDLKKGLVEQAEREESPFWIGDQSIPRAIDQGWETDAERRIAASHLVLVICGANVHNSPGVTKEVQIARRLDKPVYLLDPGARGRSRPVGVPEAQPFLPMNWRNIATMLYGRK